LVTRPLFLEVFEVEGEVVLQFLGATFEDVFSAFSVDNVDIVMA
jgi:hypothetical protein